MVVLADAPSSKSPCHETIVAGCRIVARLGRGGTSGGRIQRGDLRACAALLGAIAEQAPWARTADWYKEASGAFVLAAAEERLRVRGEAPLSWLQVKLEALAVEEGLKKQPSASLQDRRKDPELLKFCVAIGEAIVPVRMDAYKQN